MKKYGRTDANHDSVRQYFRAHGCEWEDTKDLGGGFPDALVGWGTRLALVECKTPKARTMLRTREKQDRFALRFHVWIVRTDEDAAAVVQWLKL